MVTIDFYGVYNSLKLHPDEDYILNLDKDNIRFKISEYEEKQSFILHLFGIVLSILISLPLLLLDCFQAESIEDNLKFSTRYDINDLSLNSENEIIIKRSNKKLVAFSTALNGQALDGKISITENELKKQIKAYNESRFIILFTPSVLLFALGVIIFIFSSKIGGALFLLFLFVILFFIFKGKKKDKAVIETIYQKYIR
ncbi:hypothetical protein IMSAG250_01123 [Clostridiales bacterium]|nr:hypothetical protein IMSAG250_01123 [Clostridiales bacterium]